VKDDKLQQRIDEAVDERAGEILSEKIAEHTETERNAAIFILGGVRVADRIAASLGSETMRTLLRFQAEERYLALGYKDMVEFLTKSEYSPMTKHQFYDRKEILEREGDVVFNMLNDLGVSIRQRKLLGKGNIQLDGDTVIVTTDGEEEVSIDLTDRRRLLETLTALADANADKSHKLERQQKAIDGHGDKVRELHADYDRLRASKAADAGQDPHSLAVINLNFAYRALIEAVSDMSPIEQEQFVARDFQLIADLNHDLAAAFGRKDWTTIAGRTADTPVRSSGDNKIDGIDAVIAAALEEEDESNDSELAAKL
jgi:hypothetical protein